MTAAPEILPAVGSTFPFPWERGQHLALIGDTGTGKTTLIRHLFEMTRVRYKDGEDSLRYVVIFRSKSDDVDWKGYTRVERGVEDAMRKISVRRILLAPKRPDRLREFSVALEQGLKQGEWTFLVDDLFNLQKLGWPFYSRTGDSLVEECLTNGRSIGVRVISALQRPVDATRYAVGESRVTISFMLGGRDIDTIVKDTSKLMGEACESLGEHQVAMFHRPTRRVWVGQLNLASAAFEGDYLEPLPPRR